MPTRTAVPTIAKSAAPYQRVSLSSAALLDLLPFHPGDIDDVLITPLPRHHDERGWLCELFRQDETAADLLPAMAYLSETLPGVSRGPHEHLQQTDAFCFFGPATFHLHLWDNRPESATYRCHLIAILPGDRPMAVRIPPGVVHGYRNVSAVSGMVLNLPNRLYRGEGKSDPVDEIRHEEDAKSVFRFLDGK